jgi:hypothetical protein
MRVRRQGQKTRRSRTMLLASLVRRRHALCDLHKCTVQLPNGELRMRWKIWLCSGALDSSLRHAKVMGSSCRSRSQSLARAREHDAEMTCVSEGTLESGGRRAQDREVFLSMDACVRGVPCVRGGLVDPISAGPFTPCKTLDGRRGRLHWRMGGKEEEPRRASRTRVPVQFFMSTPKGR